MHTGMNIPFNAIRMHTRRSVAAGILAIATMAGANLAAQAQCGPLCTFEGLLKSNELAAGSGGGSASASSNGNSFDFFGSSGGGINFGQPSFGQSQTGGGAPAGNAGINGAIGDVNAAAESFGF